MDDVERRYSRVVEARRLVRQGIALLHEAADVIAWELDGDMSAADVADGPGATALRTYVEWSRKVRADNRR